jgi:hypothetical protein
MSDSKLNRRTFLKGAAITASGAILAACAPAATPTTAPVAEATKAPEATATTAAPVATAVVPPPIDPSAVSWWYGWGNLTAGIDKFVQTDAYKQIMGDTKFEYKGGVPGEALLTAIAAGTPPDGQSNIQGYPNMFIKGAVIAVNDFLATSKVIKKDDVVDKLWESGFIGDQLIGVPGIEGYLWWGLNANIDTAQKDGLDPANLPTTWEDLLDWHKKETKFDDAGNLKSFGLDPWDAMAGETDFNMMSFGGINWWDEKARKMDLNNDTMIKSLDVMGEFIKIVGPDKFAGMRASDGMGSWGASYNAGMQNMIIEGYWHPGETFIQKPEVAKFNRATWAPVPASRKGKKIMATGAHFIQIFKDAKHKEGMFKFGESLFNSTFLDILFKEVGWIFGIKSWLAKVDPSVYPGLDFYIKAVDQVDEWIIGRRCPLHNFVQTQYTELREKVFRGTMTSKEAAAEMQKRADDEWVAQGLS